MADHNRPKKTSDKPKAKPKAKIAAKPKKATKTPSKKKPESKIPFPRITNRKPKPTGRRRRV